MPRKKTIDLPQNTDRWFTAVRQLSFWVNDANGKPIHPYLVLVVSLDNSLVIGLDLVPEEPSGAEIQKFLLEAMAKPSKSSLKKPSRPAEIQVESAQIARDLVPGMKRIGVEVKLESRSEEIDQIIQAFEQSIQGEQPFPDGLENVDGVTPELLRELFSAAAEYYRASPWIYLNDAQPLKAEVDPLQKTCFVQLLGNAGIEYGLLLYWRWEDLEASYLVGGYPNDLLTEGGLQSLSFENIDLLPPADVHSIQKYELEVADPNACPMPMVYQPDEVVRPERDTLILYQALLRAIPLFVRDHLEQDSNGGYLPAEHQVSVITSDGEQWVTLRYPAGILPLEARSTGTGFWFDMQDLESEPEFPDVIDNGYLDDDWANLKYSPTEPILSTLIPDSDMNPEQRKAQSLIYQAWDEFDPRTRINLAKQALEIFPDCADAYVILAQDLAVNLGQALSYYQKGVAAGERALGDPFFIENQGYFWGIFETRPYMRALAGVADCQLQMGRPKQALEVYQRMLELNPNDNQGNRYRALSLLVELNQHEESWMLIEAYKDEVSVDWLYTRALLHFRQGGPSQVAVKDLAKAVKYNSHVPAYLIGKKRLPVDLPDYISPGDENEAIDYVANNLNNWRKTPGAVDWLSELIANRPKAKSISRRRKAKQQPQKPPDSTPNQQDRE